MKKIDTTKSIVNMVIKSCVWILLIMLVVYLGMQGYQFGQKVFSEEGNELSPGRDVQITIISGDSNSKVAKTLKSEGVIADESVFALQCILYEADFKKGTHMVNTSDNAETIIETLSKSPEAEQTNGGENTPQNTDTKE